MSIRITTLGRLQVSRGDTVIAALPSQRLRCGLLVFLAVNRETTRDRLTSLFWAERTDSKARHALSQNIYELRGVLGEDWVSLRGEQVVVAPHVTIDLLAFSEAADRDDAQGAISLYRGPFLDGFYLTGSPGFEGWVEQQRLRAQRQHRRARRDHITKLVEQARMRDALQSARDWVGIDPLDDEGQHRLIELLAETGDRAGAIRQYDAYVRQLEAEELNPLDETRALVEQIRGGDVGTLPSPPVSIGTPRPSAHSLRVDVVQTPEPEARPLSVVEQPEPLSPEARTRVRRTLVALGVLVALALSGFFATRPTVEARQPAERHAVAVLYFDDHSPNGEAAQLSRFITESLTDRLASAAVLLDVRPRQLMKYYVGKDLPPDSIARATGSDLLVSGSVVQADGRVRVLIELIDASGRLVHTRTFTRDNLEYIALTDSIVDHVADVVRRQMGVHIEQRQLRADATDEAAHASLMFARELQGQAQYSPHDGGAGAMLILARADSVLAEAARRAPHWAVIGLERATVAEGRAAITLMRDTATAAAWMDTAVAHLDRVLRRDGRNVEALEMRARMRSFLTFTTNVPEDLRRYRALAMADLTEVIQVQPDRYEALGLLAELLYQEGSYNAAIRVAQRARAADTFLRNEMHNLYYEALAEFESGHESRGFAICDQARRKYTGHRAAYCTLTIMAFSDSLPAVPDTAWAIANRQRPADGREPSTQPALDMLVAAVLAKAGMPDSAVAVLERARARATLSGATAWMEPVVRLRAGQADLARAQFEQFLQLVTPDAPLVATRPFREIRAARARQRELPPR